MNILTKYYKTSSLLLGSLLALAFAPFHLFILAIFSLSGFYLLLEKASNKKESTIIGFCFGFGFFLAGNYWIAISLLVEADKFAWLIPFCLTLIPATLASYVALMGFFYHLINKKISFTCDSQKVLVFAILWLISEILRANLLSGFPWNLLGYSLLFDLRISQIASLLGIYGASFFACLISLLPILLYKFRQNRFLSLLVICGFIANFSFGFHRIKEPNQETKSIKLRLIQTNLKQEDKLDNQQKIQTILKHVELTNYSSLDNIDAVIWSEASIPYFVDDNPKLLELLSPAIPKNGVLVTGGLRVEPDKSDSEIIGRVWNSIFVINKAAIQSYYDKQHLVPFGEYIPMQKFIPFIDTISNGAVGFSKGEVKKALALKNFTFSPLICYESIFSSEAIDKAHYPDLMINLTNDSWFGNSSGPYQHLDMARMRAIEYGVNVVRVAQTGISASIDSYGKVIKQIPLNQEGIIDIEVAKSSATPTFYGKNSYLGLIFLLAIALISLLISILKFKKRDYV